MTLTDEILKIQEKVKKHLGEDAFYHEDKRVKHTLTMEELKAGLNRPSTEGYRHPDFSAYLKEPAIKHPKNEAGIIYEVKEDGSSVIHSVKPKS
ncbi:MAG TPA: hypothetical protein DGG95_14520 [Cytophagales bacterium]|nr:hypothetical protein [Cytophagales bacterium]